MPCLPIVAFFVMEPIKLPNPFQFVGASLAAWWLAHVVNPGFFAVAVMIMLMIPVLLADSYPLAGEAAATSNVTENAEENPVQENSD